MFCTSCGNPLDDNSRFCTVCGASTDEKKTLERQANRPQTCFVESGTATIPATANRTQAREKFAQAAKAANNPSDSQRKRKTTAAIAASITTLAIIGGGFGISYAISSPSTSGDSREDNSTVASTPGDTKQSDQAQHNPQQGASDDVEVRSGFTAYTWNELGSLAQKMEQCTSTQDALALAQKYHLVDDSGKLSTEPKNIMLIDNTTVAVQIIGMFEDDKADGTGKAAFSFITKNCYDNHAMNAAKTNDGGWEKSEMRSWLNSTVVSKFPAEVKSSLVPVKKLTNNIGRTETPDSVSETIDSLWLLSWTEMFGNITWNAGTDTTYIDSVLNAEGSQYRFFADNGLADSQDSDTVGVLKKYLTSGSGKTLTSWWTRSSTPNRTDGFGDVNNGGIDNGGLATASQGVVFGFCL